MCSAMWAVAVLSLPAQSWAAGKPPREAVVVPNRAMADVQIGQSARVSADESRVFGPDLKSWGPVNHRHCLIGEECAWDVPGGGSVRVYIDPDRDEVGGLETTARGWRTRPGVGAGSTKRAVKKAYPDAVESRVCAPGHGPRRGLFVAGNRRTTMLDLAPRTSKVVAVRIYTLRLDELEVPC